MVFHIQEFAMLSVLSKYRTLGYITGNGRTCELPTANNVLKDSTRTRLGLKTLIGDIS